jgi:hypothetical protein
VRRAGKGPGEGTGGSTVRPTARAQMEDEGEDSAAAGAPLSSGEPNTINRIKKTPPPVPPGMCQLTLCMYGGYDVFMNAMKEEIVKKLQAEVDELKLRENELGGMMSIVSPKRAWPDGMIRPRSIEFGHDGDYVFMQLWVKFQYGPGDIMTAQKWFRIEMRKVAEDWFMVRTDFLAAHNCVITVKHMGSDEYVHVTLKNRNPDDGDYWDGNKWVLHEECTKFKDGDQLDIRLIPNIGVSRPLSLNGFEELSYFPATIRIYGVPPPFAYTESGISSSDEVSEEQLTSSQEEIP